MRYIKLILLNILFLTLNKSFAQESPSVSVWNSSFDLKLHYLGSDTTGLLNKIRSLQTDDSINIYLVYIGDEIENPIDYPFSIDDLKAEILTIGSPWPIETGQHYQNERFIKSIGFVHDPRFDNSGYMITDSCFLFKDTLPDGKWLRVFQDTNGLYYASLKVIKNSLLQESYEWRPVEIQTSSESKYHNGKLLYREKKGPGSFRSVEIFDSCSNHIESKKYYNDTLFYFKNSSMGFSIQLNKNGRFNSFTQLDKDNNETEEIVFYSEDAVFYRRIWKNNEIVDFKTYRSLNKE